MSRDEDDLGILSCLLRADVMLLVRLRVRLIMRLSKEVRTPLVEVVYVLFILCGVFYV